MKYAFCPVCGEKLEETYNDWICVNEYCTGKVAVIKRGKN